MPKKNKALYKLIRRYTMGSLSVALAAMLFLLPIWFIAYRNTRQLYIADTTQQLRNSLNSLSANIEYMQKSAIFGMKNDDTFLRVCVGYDETPTPYQLSKLGAYYEQLHFPAPVMEMAIVFSKSDMFMLHQGIYSARQYQTAEIFSFNQMNVNSFRDYIFSSQTRTYQPGTVKFHSQNEQPCILYVSYTAANTAAFCVLLDVSKVAGMLELPEIGSECFYYLLDNEGHTLFAYNYDEEPIISPATGSVTDYGEGYTLISLENDSFSFVTGIPQTIFDKIMQPFFRQSLLYLGGALALVLLLSVGYAYFSISPLNPMLKKANSISEITHCGTLFAEEKNPYNYVYKVLDTAYIQYSSLEAEVAQLRARSEADAFRIMLSGGRAEKQTDKLLKILDSYILLVSMFDAPPETVNINHLSHAFESMVSERFPSSFALHEGYLVMVFNVPDCGGVDAIIKGIDSIRRVFITLHEGAAIRLGYSEIQSGTDNLAMAFDQAGLCLQHLMHAPGGMMTATYDTLSKKNAWLDFSFFEQYYNLLLTGNEAGVKSFYETVVRQRVNPALNTHMQESALRNLDHGDRDSLGLFQQRPSQVQLHVDVVGLEVHGPIQAVRHA